MTYWIHSYLGDFGLSVHPPLNWTSLNDLILPKGYKHFLYAENFKFLSLALISPLSRLTHPIANLPSLPGYSSDFSSLIYLLIRTHWKIYPLIRTHWKRLWCWEGLRAGGEGDNRGWDGWMASRTRWTWVWVYSGSRWWTGRPGVLRFMGSQRVRHDWVTELNKNLRPPLQSAVPMVPVLSRWYCLFSWSN